MSARHAAYQAARRTADALGQPQPDDRVLDAAIDVALAAFVEAQRAAPGYKPPPKPPWPLEDFIHVSFGPHAGPATGVSSDGGEGRLVETVVLPAPLPDAVEYVPGDPEPAPGVAALLMHPGGHVEHVHFRDDQTASDAGYNDGQRWWSVGDDVGPATWSEVVEFHDGPILLVRVPVQVP